MKPKQTAKRPFKAGKAKQQPRDPAKWLHHSLKTIHKALKQAKNFEIRKVTRRLAQARSSEGQQGASAGRSGAVAKLEQQLQAAKHADLDQLARQAAAKAGLVVNSSSLPTSSPAAAAAAQVAGLDAAVVSAVNQRLIAASCVQKQLDQQTAEFKRKFGSIKSSSQAVSAGAETSVDAQTVDDAAITGTATAAAGERASKRPKVTGHQSIATTAEPEPGPESAAAAAAAADGIDDTNGILDSADSGDVSLSDSGSEPSEDEQAESQSDDNAEEQQQADEDGQGGNNSSGSWDLEAEFEAQQRAEQQQDGELLPPSDDELDDATMAALQTLKGARAQQQQEGPSEDDDSDIVMTAAGDVVTSDDESAPPARHKQQQQQEPKKPQGAQQDQKQRQQQQQQQLSRYEKLQQKRRAKLEKLLKRGKRVGQRMRKKLLEKLYGAEAHHIKAQAGSHASRLDSRSASDRRQTRPDKQRQQQQQPRQHTQHQQQQDKEPVKQQQNSQQQELHPSWAARKQQKQPLVAGTAKKVVFGEDGETVTVKHDQQQQHQPSPRQQQPQSQPQHQKGFGHRKPIGAQHTAQRTQGQPSKLPSSKPQPQPAESQLHPSWQAKKQQQAAIALQPTGKKVVFDD